MSIRDDCHGPGWPGASGPVTFTSDSLMRVGEVCRVLNVERHTVYKFIDCDILPTVRLSPRVIRIPATAVARLIDEGGDPDR